MGGLVQTVGNGIVGLVSGAFDAIGGVLRDLVGAGQVQDHLREERQPLEPYQQIGANRRGKHTAESRQHG